ncbi:MAG: hypothetical protein JJV95_06195 [Sulfurospirillum sp.]|nr:hypothetical protein [Sulfurospirillum sp.]
MADSKIFDMTIKEYEEYISTELEVDALDTVYVSPKVVTKNAKMKILTKRLETFFEEDKDINRNSNICRAYSYGYAKTEIAGFLKLTTKTIGKIIS